MLDFDFIVNVNVTEKDEYLYRKIKLKKNALRKYKCDN